MPGPDSPVIEVEDLVVSYGPRRAVDGVDLEVAPGEVVALLGRNGAGKTSTVETLEGYRRASGGTVRVLGLDPGRPEDHRTLTKSVGVMLQRGGIYPSMGPAESLRLFARYYDEPADPGQLMERLGLSGVARTSWRRLSGGEQQRLSLALALVGRPEVVFLDEPTAGVDPQGRISIREEIASLRESGVTVLLTTHELDEAERVADRIVIIDHGRVVASGTLAELTSTGGRARQTRFRATPRLDVEALSEVIGAAIHEEEAGRYLIDAPSAPAMVARLTAWMAEQDITINDLRSGHESLEEAFLRLTSAGPEGESSGDR